jgi:hypothetical protein
VRETPSHQNEKRLTKKREEVEQKRQLKETTVKERLSKLAEVLGEQLATLATNQLTQ